MKDSEAKKAWVKANTIQATVKLNRNTDADIFAFYGDKISGAMLKMVLRFYIANHKDD